MSSISTRRTTRQSNQKEEEAFPDPPSPKAASASTAQPRKKKFTLADNIFTIVSLILFFSLFAQWFVITLRRWVDKVKAEGAWQL